MPSTPSAASTTSKPILPRYFRRISRIVWESSTTRACTGRLLLRTSSLDAWLPKNGFCASLVPLHGFQSAHRSIQGNGGRAYWQVPDRAAFSSVSSLIFELGDESLQLCRPFG